MAHDIVVIAASAGGVQTVVQLVAQLPEKLPASLFLVQHIPASPPSRLPSILGRAGLLPAFHPTEGMMIEPGKIYVAPPDRHLIIEDGHLHLGTGAKEHYVRPAANVLFRSAAHNYRERVVGIVLTGLDHDGAEGLLAIKEHGGIAIIQDPREAPFPQMPESALRQSHVDYVVSLAEMIPLLIRLVSS
jgi:two-component system, chemotaxis family, protein-glutamate methylesterase/glutaminase